MNEPKMTLAILQALDEAIERGFMERVFENGVVIGVRLTPAGEEYARKLIFSSTGTEEESGNGE